MVELRPELAADGAAQLQVPAIVMAAACRAASNRELEIPLPFRHNNLSLVADVRLDNGRELTDSLVGQGTPLLPDVELIARGYECWGAEAAGRLEGDFAFVLWDAAQQRLVAGRDGMGVRPLFFARHGGTLWLASDVEQLMLVPGLPLELDDEAVLDYLTWETHLIDTSMFRSVRRVRPGHLLIATQGAVYQRRFWSPHDEIGRAPSVDGEEAFRDALRHSVRQRLESSRPVLAHLSGGLDSSSIVCLADQLCSDGHGPAAGCIAVSGVFPGWDCDESQYIEAVVKHLRTVRHESWDGRRAEWDDLDDPLPDWPGLRIQFAGGSSGDVRIAQKHGARVLLSGEFGDEVCDDHQVLPELAAGARWIEVADETLLASRQSWMWRRRELRRTLSSLAPASLRRWRRQQHVEGPPPWLAPRLEPRWHARQEDGLRRAAGPRRTSAEHVADLLGHATILALVDAEQRGAGAAGLELRFPFLSRDVIRKSLSLELDQRRPRGIRRGFQRRAMVGVLPAFVVRRRKSFFNIARIQQVRQVMPRLRAMLSGVGFAAEPFVRPGSALKMLETLSSHPERVDEWQDWHVLLRIANLISWIPNALAPRGKGYR